MNRDMEAERCRFSPLMTVAEGRVKRDYQEMTSSPYPHPHIHTTISPPSTEHFTICLPVSLRPLLGPFQACAFHCVICMSSGFPFHPPWVQVRNRVPHPNISLSTGLVDLPIVNPASWHREITLHNVLFSLQQLLLAPDYSSAVASMLPHFQSNVSLKRRPEIDPNEGFKRQKTCKLTDFCQISP